MRVKADSEQWLEKSLYDRWQRVRRHPEYVAFCEEKKDKFDTDGYIVDEWIYNNDEKAIAIRKKFGIDLIWHYSKDIPENEMLAALLFRKSLPVEHLWPERPFSEKGRIVITPLFDNRFIRLEIDVNANTEQILGTVKEFIEHARANIIDFKKERSDLEQRIEAYSAWDLRLKHTDWTWPQIALKYYSEETKNDAGEGLVADRLIKRFKRAYELIYDAPYNPEKINAQLNFLKEEEFKIKCINCPNRDTQECLTCPAILSILKGAEGYQRELTVEQEVLDYLHHDENYK